MSFSTNDAAIKMSPALESEIAKAGSVSQIQDILHRHAAEQHLISRDELDRDGSDYFSHKVNEPVAAAIANAPHVKILNINGIKHTVQSDTAEGLVGAELAKMRELFGTTAAAEPVEQPRNERGQFIAADADPAAESLAPTVMAALESQGISIADLREFSQAKRADTYTKSWSDAGLEFQRQNPNWEGGKANMETVARVISELKLADADDKVSALHQAVKYARENNRLIANPATAIHDAVSAATSFDDIKRAVGYRDASVNSGLWGR